MKIAFDLDGTLITAKERQTLLLAAAAKAYGIDIDVDRLWELKREGASNLIALNKIGVKELLAAKIDAVWRYEIESFYWLGLDQVYSDVINFLQNLTCSGASLYLITARRSEFLLTQQLRRLQLLKFFSTITCVSPFNAVAEKARVLNKLNPDFFVGDSEADFNAAAWANVKFLGVCTGQRSKGYLENLGAGNVVNSLSSLAPLLLKP